MITFKKYLQELAPQENAYVPAAADAKEFIEWCEKNAPMYLKKMWRNPIFRGMDGPWLGIMDTNKMNRRSANTRNYYTIWLDNNQEWKEYPKRSKSLICSTSNYTAEGFGDVKLIIPADSNKIGMCDESDLWGSFPFLSDRIPVAENDLDTYMSIVHAIMEYVQGKVPSVSAEAASNNYPALVKMLQAITIPMLEEYCNQLPKSNTWDIDSINKLIAAMNKYGYATLYDVFNDTMDPDENNFTIYTGATFKAKQDKEVWIQGECAVVSFEHLRELMSEDNETDPLTQFIAKYNLQELLE